MKIFLKCFVIFVVVSLLCSIPVSAAPIKFEGGENEAGTNGHELTDPSLKEDGFRYPSLFTMTANEVHQEVVTSPPKTITVARLNNLGAEYIHFGGTLYHTKADTDAECIIRFGIGYYVSAGVAIYPKISYEVGSGENFSADQKKAKISDWNLSPHVTYYGFITNINPRDSGGVTDCYVYGTVNVYYS